MNDRTTLSRRAFLGGGAAVAGGLALGSTFVTRRGGGTRTLRVANWKYYIDDETLRAFTAETGIRVDYRDLIDDNVEFYDSIRGALEAGRDPGYDVIVVTDWMAAQMIFSGYATRLDRLRVPNKVNIVPELGAVSYDPNRVYSLPWLSGMTGIAYDSAKVKVTSIDALLDPSLSDRVAVLSESRDTVGLLLLSMGKDPATCTPADIRAAIDKLAAARAKSRIKVMGNEYLEELQAGRVVACMAWAGDLVSLAESNPSIRWVVPDAGGMIYTDTMIVPRHAANADLAEVWMNYMFDPAHAARLSAGTSFVSPVKGAIDETRRIDPAAADNPLVNPSAEMRAELSTFRYLDPASQKAFDDQWRTVTA